MEDLRYPIGRFAYTAGAGEQQREAWLSQIAQTPDRLREAVSGLANARIDTAYREGGWTVRQIVHHLPDSHLNSYTRFRLALTEDNPMIKPYHEDRWAELVDARSAPLEVSLDLLDALHKRWMILLRSLNTADWTRSFQHPELGAMSLEKNLALYAWHGSHHVAHIATLKKRMGW
jgi:hypothetical protein